MSLIHIDNGVVILAIDDVTKKLQVVSSTGGKITLIKEVVFT